MDTKSPGGNKSVVLELCLDAEDGAAGDDGNHYAMDMYAYRPEVSTPEAYDFLGDRLAYDFAPVPHAGGDKPGALSIYADADAYGDAGAGAGADADSASAEEGAADAEEGAADDGGAADADADAASFAYSDACGAGASAGASAGDRRETDAYAERVISVLREFEAKTSESGWPTSTNTACYWCCHGFATVPMGLPVKYETDGAMTATGCFCSVACAAAYNQYGTESINVKVARHSMLTNLALHMGMDEDIATAPPREVLKMFGGQMDIDEFRQLLHKKHVFLQTHPPMRYKHAHIEEVSRDKITAMYREQVVPLDTARVKRGMTLAREKPLVPFKNTLGHTMNLTIRPAASGAAEA